MSLSDCTYLCYEGRLRRTDLQPRGDGGALTFRALLKDGFIWGRGTTDNKDCVAAGLMLMLELKRLQVPLDRDVIFVAEASEESEAIRTRVASVFANNQASVAYCLEAAIDADELTPNTDVQELAGFIVSSLQGAILVAKAQRSPIPVERFERVLFQQLLPQGDTATKRRGRVAR